MKKIGAMLCDWFDTAYMVLLWWAVLIAPVMIGGLVIELLFKFTIPPWFWLALGIAALGQGILNAVRDRGLEEKNL